jgi:uncharacterized delta-60 repeat protein
MVGLFRTSFVIVVSTFALVATQGDVAFAAAGDLDTTFSGDGKFVTDFTTGDDLAYGVAIQADGKIVAAGQAAGFGGRFALTRYNTNGTLDATFGGDGKFVTDFTTGDDVAFGVAVQPSDQKIVAVGRAGGGGGRFALARYTTTGSLDPTFNGDGKLATDFTTGDDLAFAVVIQTDGKIVAVGRAGGGGGRFALARYTTTGSLDPTFNGDGKVAANFTVDDDAAFAAAIQSDDKVVAAGYVDGSDPKFALTRFTTTGSLDPTFSGDGKLTTNFTTGVDFAFGVAIQPSDQKIVAAGRAGGSGGRFALGRYNTNGTLDASFSGDGKLTTDFTSGDDIAFGVAIQADQKIVAAGGAGGADVTFALTRYNTNGTLDATFSGDGKVTTNITTGVDFATGVAIQPSDQKIVAVGRSGNAGGRFAVTRYLAA